MSKKAMYYNAEADKWYTLNKIIKCIQESTECTETEANVYLDDSIENGIIYDYNGYMEHFAPYENN